MILTDGMYEIIWKYMNGEFVYELGIEIQVRNLECHKQKSEFFLWKSILNANQKINRNQQYNVLG